MKQSSSLIQEFFILALQQNGWAKWNLSSLWANDEVERPGIGVKTVGERIDDVTTATSPSSLAFCVFGYGAMIKPRR